LSFSIYALNDMHIAIMCSMQIIKQVPFEAVVHAWLKAEWYGEFFNPVRNYVPQALIDDDDFNNQQNNELRYWLLRALRFNMLETLPPGITWYSATYDSADIRRTFIVPSNDWGPISGNTYQPYVIMQNIARDPNSTDAHAVKIKNIRASLPTIDRRLIFVASDMNSLLTIIEGNHRAVAIFADALDRGAPDPIIAEVFVGVSLDMRQYMFSIERYIAPINVQRPGP
jgi:hypothetical protein